MKTRTFITLAILLPLASHAASTATYTYNIHTAIPDNNGIGMINTQWVTTPITSISGINIQLTLAGGWCGDVYAYLTHDSGFVVLLNRPGRSLDDPFGSGAANLSVNFADNAPNDIHTGIPNTGTAIGIYQPDARMIDPDDAWDTSPRTAFLSSFDGLDANGDWTLFVADVATGDIMTLDSWSLTVTGVPEPSAATLAVLGMSGLLLRRRRHEVPAQSSPPLDRHANDPLCSEAL
jgi:uncharacterized protein (TIGR03382 family)